MAFGEHDLFILVPPDYIPMSNFQSDFTPSMVKNMQKFTDCLNNIAQITYPSCGPLLHFLYQPRTPHAEDFHPTLAPLDALYMVTAGIVNGSIPPELQDPELAAQHRSKIARGLTHLMDTIRGLSMDGYVFDDPRWETYTQKNRLTRSKYKARGSRNDGHAIAIEMRPGQNVEDILVEWHQFPFYEDRRNDGLLTSLLSHMLLAVRRSPDDPTSAQLTMSLSVKEIDWKEDAHNSDRLWHDRYRRPRELFDEYFQPHKHHIVLAQGTFNSCDEALLEIMKFLNIDYMHQSVA